VFRGLVAGQVLTPYDTNSQYLPHAALRLIGRAYHMPADLELLKWFCVSLAAVDGLALNRFARKRTADEAAWAFALVLLSLPLLLHTSWPHYFVYLPFVQMLGLIDVQRERRAWIGAVKLGLVVISIALGHMALMRVIGWDAFTRHACLFLSNMLLLPVVYMHLWQSRAPSDGPPPDELRKERPRATTAPLATAGAPGSAGARS